MTGACSNPDARVGAGGQPCSRGGGGGAPRVAMTGRACGPAQAVGVEVGAASAPVARAARRASRRSRAPSTTQ